MEENQSERIRLIEALAESLLGRRNEAIEARAASGVERRWREDQKTFDGLDQDATKSMIDYATGEAPLPEQGPRRSKVLINVIRGKCETAEGRFSDIQFPVDDKNWGLKVTPSPLIATSIKDNRQAARDGKPLSTADGKPIRMKDVAKSDLQFAKDKMEKMETEIDDQLTECSYNAECRKVIRDAVRLGTGILKGPNVVKRLNRSWSQKDGVYTIEMVEDFRPASRRVDPWNVYPDPDCEDDISRAACIWERDEILPREVRNLIGVRGYLDDQILRVLEEEPKRTAVIVNKSQKHQVKQSTESKGSTYERWEYYGDLKKDDMEALGVDVGEVQNESVSACVVFINDRPVKVQLNTLDSGELPYDFFQWTTVDGSPWGIGIPRIALWQQRVMTAAWRAMMDNAGDSAGANIIVGSGLEPADGKWEITGKKIWRALGEVEDVRAAFAQFQVTNNQAELQAIIELALKFIDMETALPMMFQGEKGEIPETLGATNIMVDANNVALRARVKLWDDRITRPHITRYYDWNMQYSDKEEIRGDYSVDVRGVSALLEKDQQAKTLLQVWALKQDPDIKKEIDWKKALKQLFNALHLDILKDEEDKEGEGEPQPPQDPRIAAAQIRAQSELEKAKMVQQATMEELNLKAKMAEDERVHEEKLKVYDFKIKQMEYAEKSGISLAKIKSELSRDAAKINLQRELSTATGKAEQVVEPVSEPAGRAPDGQAFQK